MDNSIIANIKSLGIDMIQEASSGHPGIVLSSAPIVYSLYANHLRFLPDKPNWFNRDRFVMSAGHGSALLYATLYMCGYSLTLEDLKNFRQLDSKTPGHPELRKTAGVECSTGPLGQGIATSVGIALGQKILQEQYPFCRFNTYVLVGDGDLMEGISYESCSLAGTLNLDNLIILYDSNDITLDGTTEHTFKENVLKRFESFGFATYFVEDGNNLDLINEAIDNAKKDNKPSFIEIKTKLGYGSLLENTNQVHGKPLDDADVDQLKKKLNVPLEPFSVDEELRNQLINKINNQNLKEYRKSIDECTKYIQKQNHNTIDAVKDLFQLQNYNVLNYDYDLPTMSEATRETNQKIMTEISKHIPLFLGGSADLNSSTKVYLKDMGDIKRNSFNGKNIWFGIREHAMGAIINGLALLNIRSFASTFLSFSDYMKPSLRMAALMDLPTTFIFTHDSILVGEDGPTHQPVEQLTMLRSIPNFTVYRPADAKELLGCWQSIISLKHPCSLILSRTKVNQLENTSCEKTLKGGYVVSDDNNLDLIIISTGTELETAIKLKEDLQDYHIRVISMPSKELFLKQTIDYQKDILLDGVKTVVIEASNSYSFNDIADYVIGINQFGYSAKSEDLLQKMQYDYNSIKQQLINIILK